MDYLIGELKAIGVIVVVLAVIAFLLSVGFTIFYWMWKLMEAIWG